MVTPPQGPCEVVVASPAMFVSIGRSNVIQNIDFVIYLTPSIYTSHVARRSPPEKRGRANPFLEPIPFPRFKLEMS
jgi:hypothetical protein